MHCRKGGACSPWAAKPPAASATCWPPDLKGKGTGNGFHIKSATTRGGTVEDIRFEM